MNTTTTRRHALPARITLVSAPNCHFCDEAKKLLQRLAREYPLEIEEVSLMSPQGEDIATRHGVLFPPGLLLDGSLVGFGRPSERKLRRLLDERAAATRPSV